MSTEMTYKYW